jgi:hypothetical protein
MANEHCATGRLCACGCGRQTNIATSSDPKRGHVKGQPHKFAAGHRITTPPIERVRRKCIWIGGCFVWQGETLPNGYGQIRIRRRHYYVHRIVYVAVNGPIPEGLQIDHVKARGCRFKTCCNADHLEAVTGRENLLRGNGASAMNARKTHYKNGHLLAGDNLLPSGVRQGMRRCRPCWNAQQRTKRAHRKQGTT